MSLNCGHIIADANGGEVIISILNPFARIAIQVWEQRIWMISYKVLNRFIAFV